MRAPFYPILLGVPTQENLLKYSEQFDQGTVWADLSAGTTVVTANAVLAPDGTLTADQLVGNNTNTFLGQSIVVGVGPYTFPIWLRSDAPVTRTIQIAKSGSQAASVNLTTTWQRFWVTYVVPSSGTAQCSVNIGNAVNVFAWGAQLNRGIRPANYRVTTTAPWP